MNYISSKEAALNWNVSERRIRKLCENQLIEGAYKEGVFWKIPSDAKKPLDGRCKAIKRVVIATSSALTGKIIAEGFIKLGYNVTIICNEDIFLDNVQSFKCDINDTKAMEKIFEQIDRIDTLIIFPSSYLPKRIDDVTVAEFDLYSNIIIKNTYNIVKYSIKKIRENKGNIILLHSSVAVNPEPGATIYSMLQSTLIMLGKSLALSEGKYKVTVNNVLLGPAPTENLNKQITRTQYREWKKINPLGVSFKIEDCLEILINISSRRGSYSKMTGAVIAVDGGECVADAYTYLIKGDE